MQEREYPVYWWRDSSSTFANKTVLVMKVWLTCVCVCVCVCVQVSEAPGVSQHGSVLGISWPGIWDLTCCRSML